MATSRTSRHLSPDQGVPDDRALLHGAQGSDHEGHAREGHARLEADPCRSAHPIQGRYHRVGRRLCVLGVLPFFGVVFVVWSGWISRRDSQCVCYSSPASKLDEVAICQIFRMCACDSQRSNVMQGWILSIHSLNAKHRISN